MASYTDKHRNFVVASGQTVYYGDRIKLSASANPPTISVAGAGEDWHGVSLEAVAKTAGQTCACKLRNDGGTMKMRAAGAITALAKVYGAADGEIDDTASGEVIGIALFATSNADEMVEVLPWGGSDNRFASINDVNDNEALKITATASAVNELTLTNAATGNGVSLLATGGDTNVSAQFGGKGTGQVLLGQATCAGVKLVASQPIMDENANELLKFTATGSAVNEITIANAATGNGPSLTASGETNVPITLAGKGTGLVALGQATSIGIKAVADQPILDSSENELIKFSKATTAVNEVTVGNAATTTAPTLAATGGDANIPLDLVAKGTGVVRARAMTCKKLTQTATTDTATITIAQLLTGILDGTPTAAAAYTLPTAADLVAGIVGARVGDSFEFLINNKSAGANTITVAAGSGGTADGTLTVAQHVIRKFVVIVTNVTGSSEAYFVYGLGA